ncbi:MAG TPA: chalcone isomerase family protein [Terriglobales bacterium]|nr:chalcone isomerase family protein [Terriglobales bacterium]
MRTTVTLLSILMIVVAPMSDVFAASAAGVTLPDAVQAGGKTLVLNGLGLRTKFVVKVYVAGLYLEQKSSDANAILKADSPKRLVMHFLRDVSKEQMADAFNESFDNNAPDAKKAMKADIDRLLNALEPLKEGQEMIFTYVPGTGTTMMIGGKDKLTIAGPAFAPVLFSIWLGPKPPNASLKKGILGQ